MENVEKRMRRYAPSLCLFLASCAQMPSVDTYFAPNTGVQGQSPENQDAVMKCINTVRQYTLKIEMRDDKGKVRSHGTGVKVDGGGIVTAKHVINSEGVIFSGQKPLSVVSVYGGVAVLVEGDETTNKKGVPISDVSLQEGDEIHAFGFPRTLPPTVVGGVYDGENRVVQTDFRRGMSGGPVVTCRNGKPKLVGIIEGFTAILSGKERQEYHDIGHLQPLSDIIAALKEWYWYALHSGSSHPYK